MVNKLLRTFLVFLLNSDISALFIAKVMEAKNSLYLLYHD